MNAGAGCGLSGAAGCASVVEGSGGAAGPVCRAIPVAAERARMSALQAVRVNECGALVVMRLS